MQKKPIALAEKLSKIHEHWSPKIIAQMNDYHFKLVKIQGEFIWHSHPETDEVFLVLQGRMVIHFREGEVELNSGELFVVPKGCEHKPSASEECQIMLIEPAGTVNTGDTGGKLTVENDAWV
ncbi:MAG: cupin [Chloroflexi bacterium RBG_19FT_COMBO_62_14]|nr:MAG: cupin [Chloroflexi bacterium RBG_19FT_COMBO_62_14]